MSGFGDFKMLPAWGGYPADAWWYVLGSGIAGPPRESPGHPNDCTCYHCHRGVAPPDAGARSLEAEGREDGHA